MRLCGYEACPWKRPWVALQSWQWERRSGYTAAPRCTTRRSASFYSCSMYDGTTFWFAAVLRYCDIVGCKLLQKWLWMRKWWLKKIFLVMQMGFVWQEQSRSETFWNRVWNTLILTQFHIFLTVWVSCTVLFWLTYLVCYSESHSEKFRRHTTNNGNNVICWHCHYSNGTNPIQHCTKLSLRVFPEGPLKCPFFSQFTAPGKVGSNSLMIWDFCYSPLIVSDRISELAVIFYGYFTHLAGNSNNDGNGIRVSHASKHLFFAFIHSPLSPDPYLDDFILVVLSGDNKQLRRKHFSEMEPSHTLHLPTSSQSGLTDNLSLLHHPDVLNVH